MARPLLSASFIHGWCRARRLLQAHNDMCNMETAVTVIAVGASAAALFTLPVIQSVPFACAAAWFRTKIWHAPQPDPELDAFRTRYSLNRGLPGTILDLDTKASNFGGTLGARLTEITRPADTDPKVLEDEVCDIVARCVLYES